MKGKFSAQIFGTSSIRTLHIPNKSTRSNVLLRINPLVPDAHYCERQEKLATLQNKLLEDTR